MVVRETEPTPAAQELMRVGLASGNPFHYLTTLLDHAAQVADEPQAWLPWTDEASLEALPA